MCTKILSSQQWGLVSTLIEWASVPWCWRKKRNFISIVFHKFAKPAIGMSSVVLYQCLQCHVLMCLLGWCAVDDFSSRLEQTHFLSLASSCAMLFFDFSFSFCTDCGLSSLSMATDTAAAVCVASSVINVFHSLPLSFHCLHPTIVRVFFSL